MVIISLIDTDASVEPKVMRVGSEIVRNNAVGIETLSQIRDTLGLSKNLIIRRRVCMKADERD